MGKVKAILSAEVANYIRENYPIVGKRTALWFFLNDNTPNRDMSATEGDPEARQHSRRNKMFNMWKKMKPESKRKYFNMAEFDSLRYKEQKSQWVSEVCALLLKHNATIESLSELAPSHDDLQKDFLTSLNKLHKNYEQMIQIESTKELYKDAIKKAEYYESSQDQEELLSSVPQSQRSVLTRPRRPPSGFALYVIDNKERLTVARRDAKSKDSLLTLASYEWLALDESLKLDYEKRYHQLKMDYTKAMEEFKSVSNQSSDKSLQKANKEKKAFKRSLRKRLRDLAVLPLSVRNAFNFFVSDNKDIPLIELTKIWHTLPMEKRAKYLQLNQDDIVRYKNEREVYNELTKALNDLIPTKKRRRPIASRALDRPDPAARPEEEPTERA